MDSRINDVNANDYMDKSSRLKLMNFLLLPLIALILSLICFIILLGFGSILVNDKHSTIDLLNGYYNAYMYLTIFVFAFAIIILISSTITALYIFRNFDLVMSFFKKKLGLEYINSRKFKKFLRVVVFLPMAIMPCFLYYFIEYEKPFDSIKIIKEDIIQAKNNNFTESIVMFNNNFGEDTMLMEFNKNAECPTIRHSAINIYDNSIGWKDFYFPKYLNFELSEDSIFNEYKSINWNQENVKAYKIRHTDNLNLVTSFEVLN